MTDESTQQLLERVGLSEKEVDAYLAVLEHGAATTGTIADVSGVSQRYVYNVIEQLEDRGLVEVNDHTVPKRVKAVPPNQALGDLVDDLRSAQTRLRTRYEEPAEESTTFRILKSRQTALKQIRNLLSDADEEAFLALPQHIVDDLCDDLESAFQRNVSILLLESDVEDPFDESRAEARFAGMASVVRQWQYDIPFTVTVDGTSGVVGQRGLLGSRHGRYRAAKIGQAEIAGSLFGAFLGSYWPEATEVYVSGPRELPQTYTMMRPVVLQATLHRRAGIDVTAEAVVTPSEEGHDREFVVEGRVVEVKQGLVEPTTNDRLAIESGVVIDTEDDRVSVGGEGAFIENYSATETTLRVNPS